MIYLELLFKFFRIGLFTIGGGYAMLPLMQHEIEINNWITSQEFVDIIAIAEMTPGPIAINAATFIGYRVGGVLGSVVATTAVVLPSLLIILLLSRILARYQEHAFVKACLPESYLVAGLIISSNGLSFGSRACTVEMSCLSIMQVRDSSPGFLHTSIGLIRSIITALNSWMVIF